MYCVCLQKFPVFQRYSIVFLHIGVSGMEKYFILCVVVFYGRVCLCQGCTTFCYCRPHYFYLYEVRPPMSSSYIYEILPSANQHRTHSNINAQSFYNYLLHHHPDCYSSCRLIFLRCVCFASIYASTAAKSYILNYMWTAANFIIEGRMSCTVGLCSLVMEVTLLLW